MKANEIIREVVDNLSSDDIFEIIKNLSDEPELSFCDQCELGNWFYEYLLKNDVDIETILSEIAWDFRKCELEAEKESSFLRQDYEDMTR